MGENETRFLSLSGQGFQLIRGTVMAEKKEFIRIRGARENNLKALNVDIPRNQFVVFTGLSGSGKSSLAFDTIYAEGQRRYMESLSSYARQFLGQMEKPNVDSIEGLPPAISIDQKSTNRNPRSTVGTVTEIYDYFRLLYARIGIPHCPKCGKDIVLRKTKKGRRYYGCEDNPECDFMSWQKPSEEKCPKCGSYMVEKGNKLVCGNEQCGFVKNKEKDEK